MRDHTEGRDDEPLECLDGLGDDCEGPIEMHSIDPGRTGAFPRCAKHWNYRLERRENSIERYESSDVAPEWLDASAINERWEDD